MATFDASEADGVLTVVLARPERLNAFNDQMRDELEACWRALDPGVRVIVLTGSGRGFCSGADMDLLAGERVSRGEVADELAFLPGRHVEVPVIVAVNGVCAGGGLHFVADADIVIAGRSASFLDPHVSVGQVSGMEPASLLPRIGFGAAARLALLGSAGRIDAEEALRIGLVDELVDDDALVPRAHEAAAAIAAASPAAVRATRRVLRDLADGMVHDAMAVGWKANTAHWEHPDSVEGPMAFQERRPPRWAPPA